MPPSVLRRAKPSCLPAWRYRVHAYVVAFFASEPICSVSSFMQLFSSQPQPSASCPATSWRPPHAPSWRRDTTPGALRCPRLSHLHPPPAGSRRRSPTHAVRRSATAWSHDSRGHRPTAHSSAQIWNATHCRTKMFSFGSAENLKSKSCWDHLLRCTLEARLKAFQKNSAIAKASWCPWRAGFLGSKLGFRTELAPNSPHALHS